MIAGKTLLDYTNLFSPNNYKENDKIIYKYFKERCGKRKRKPWLRLKKIDETRNYLLDEIKHDLTSEKRKRRCGPFNCFEHFCVFVSAISGCVTISPFASLVGVPVGIASSAVGLKICAITAGIKKM